MFVFIKAMLAMIRIIWIWNESYHYKMAFGLCVWKKHNFYVIHFLSLTVLRPVELPQDYQVSSLSGGMEMLHVRLGPS